MFLLVLIASESRVSNLLALFCRIADSAGTDYCASRQSSPQEVRLASRNYRGVLQRKSDLRWCARETRTSDLFAPEAERWPLFAPFIPPTIVCLQQPGESAL